MKPKVRERDVQAAVREWLALQGVTHWRINQQGVPLHDGSGKYRRGPHRGIADILGILPGGRFLAVEVKKPGGKVRPEQWEFLRQVCDAGGVGMVVAGVDELAEKMAEYVSERLVP